MTRRLQRPAKPKPLVKPAPAPAVEANKGKWVGTVTHYFPQVKAAGIRLQKGSLSVSDRIFVEGLKGQFDQTIDSMQINREPVRTAKPGDEIGIRVIQEVFQGDRVYRL